MATKVSKSILFRITPVLGIVGLILSSSSAWSAKLYQITGEVTEVRKNTVSLRRAGENFEFSRPTHLGLLKKGDRITILYRLDARQITPAPEDPGIIPEGESGPERESGPSKQIILDDRAFYNAKVPSHQTQKNPG